MMRMPPLASRFRHLLAPILVLASLFGTGTAAHAQSGKGREWIVYVGTYTNGQSTSKGIQMMRLDRQTGQLSAPQLAVESESPSFITLDEKRHLLFAINEVGQFGGSPGGGVTAFRIGPKGALTKINEQNSGGNGPCFIGLDKKTTFAFVANYGGGSVSVLPIQRDGSLKAATGHIQHEGVGPDPQRQKGPHAHSINVDPSGKFAIAADLGLDKLFVYKIDNKTGKIAPNTPPAGIAPPGSGPRHVAFHPNGKVLYAINELKSTMTVFGWDKKKGTLTELQTLSTLPKDFTGQSFTAEVQVHPSGRFVYGSNRGHDSISVFAVDAATGKLTLTGTQSTGGSWPRNFRLDPSGAFLLVANQRGNNVVVLKVDQRTGQLTPTGVTAEVSAPACIKFANP
jgi:6-phosphogluconolactonase